MKSKKFLYRPLCEPAEVPIGKSPRCAECCDYATCFGPEEAAIDSSCPCLLVIMGQ